MHTAPGVDSRPLAPQRHDAMLAMLKQGRFSTLAKAARQACHDHPEDGRTWQWLGVASLALGQPEEAARGLEEAATRMPLSASVQDNLGLAYDRMGDFVAARRCFIRATELQPDLVSAWVNWSHTAACSGDTDQAELCIRKALSFDPKAPSARLALGNLLARQCRWSEAEASIADTLRAWPGWLEAELSQGAILENTGQLRRAADLLRDLGGRHPREWRVWCNLGRVHSSLGDTRLAQDAYRHAISLNPNAHEAYSGLLFHLLHDGTHAPEAIFAEHRRFGELAEAPFRAHWPRHDNTRDSERRLRIGLVSGDLRHHALAFFIEPLLAELDHHLIEVHAYANHPVEDEVSRRLRRHVHAWRQVIDQGDDSLARCIRDDRIDILIDLSGHTAYNRLLVFARKPAPIQVSWLGYPGTTGLRAMDYRLLQRLVAVNGELDARFTEKLVYLPAATPFTTAADAPDVGVLPALSRGHITFGSLNRPSKIGAPVVAAWSRIMRACPGSRMLLGAISDNDTAQRLIEEFALHGVEASRLDFRPRLPLNEYLALHHDIDILLDAFPYAGGTTTNHALWMGVPTVTLAGDSLPQRAGAMILAKAGLHDWIARDEETYVGIAVSAAAQPDRLAELRAGLRQRLIGRDDLRAERMARSLEGALRVMWRRWCAGLPPESFEAPR